MEGNVSNQSEMLGIFSGVQKVLDNDLELKEVSKLTSNCNYHIQYCYCLENTSFGT